VPNLIDSLNIEWNSYHLTCFKSGTTVNRHRRFDWQAPPPATGPDMFAASKLALHTHVSFAARAHTNVGVMGRNWSFSNIIGNEKLQLELASAIAPPAAPSPLQPAPPAMGVVSGMIGCAVVPQADLSPHCGILSDTLAYVAGGASMRDLAGWAESNGRSLMTSGSQLGPSVAGACATGTHGSRLGYGGVQNMVRGMHLICDGEKSVWIEPRHSPILSDHVAKKFADEVIRDDNIFNDVLVHLGGMGIVNGLVVELGPNTSYSVLRKKRVLGDQIDTWSRLVRDKNYDGVTKFLDPSIDASPCFYEVSIDPFDPQNKPSFHTLFFAVSPSSVATERMSLPEPTNFLQGPIDTVSDVARSLMLFKERSGERPPLDLPQQYDQRFVEMTPTDHGPATWANLFGDQISGDIPGALYNAAFAVPQERFDDVRKAICAPFASEQRREFIFTFRFVHNAAGTMSHLRFADSVAIEIDGFSDAILNYVSGGQITTGICQSAAAQVKAALTAVSIPYHMHWAKLATDDPSIIAVDFGSAIQRYRNTRNTLLSPEGRATMQNRLLTEKAIL